MSISSHDFNSGNPLNRLLCLSVICGSFTVLYFLRSQLDLATKGEGGIGTFIGICAITGAFGIADAHVQGGMVGDLSFMLPEFIQVQ